LLDSRQKRHHDPIFDFVAERHSAIFDKHLNHYQ
jgi:hypothetical protein